MRTSPMWLAVLPLSFLLIHPFATSSCPSKLPCNSTIEIRPPFFVDTPGLDPACRGSINVSCGDFGPELNLITRSKLLLKDISYGSSNTVTVEDVELSVLKALPCSLTFSFTPPVLDFQSSYPNLERWFSSINCGSSSNLALFRSMFGDDKGVHQSVEPDERAPAPCHASPLFEWILHFGELGSSSGEIPQVNFSVLSASIKKDLGSSTDCSSWPTTGGGDRGNKSYTRVFMAVSVSVASGLLVACFLIVLKQKDWKNPFTLRRINLETKENIEMILSRCGLKPKRYKYNELKIITWSFKEKLGRGGYGMVFKGALKDGRLVAVKILHNSRGNDEEFVNEVVSIVNTSHVNIVCLLGFCLERSKRGLVYEYMPNGSLKRYIYSENPKSPLGWEQLYEIASGIARGLEYLHKGCNRRIIHFDIKPQNILLDENYSPKIADFGLAKLCKPKESVVSMAGARGTIGFIAPKVFSRSFGVVSTKSDIYSYGMMLLEMVGGRRNVQTNAENSSQIYLPQWLHEHLSQGGTLENFEVTTTTEEIARKMALIGLHCIQMMPEARPSISKVIEMLERSVTELEILAMQFYSYPSKPSNHSITTSREEFVGLDLMSATE